MWVLLAMACARPAPPSIEADAWEPGAPIVGEVGFGPSRDHADVDGTGTVAVLRRGDRFQLWERDGAGMRLVQELRGALYEGAAGDGVGWVVRDDTVLQVTRWGARPIAALPDGAVFVGSLHAVGDVAAFVAGEAVLFLPSGERAIVPPYTPQRPLVYPERAGPELVWKPEDPNGPLVRPASDAEAGELGGEPVLAVAYGEGTVDVWALDARAHVRRLHVTPEAYRGLGEVAVGREAVYGLVFSPAVALVEWSIRGRPARGGHAGEAAPRESAVPESLAAASTMRGAPRGLRWTPEGLVAWAGAEVWRRDASGAWTRLPDLPEGGVVARDGSVVALAEDGAIRLGERRVPARRRMEWLAARDGRWCVGTAQDARCFDGVDGEPVAVDVAGWSGDLVAGKLHVLTREGAWARPEEGLPPREVDPEARRVAVSEETGIAAFGTRDGRLLLIDGEDVSEIKVGSGWVEGLVWEGGRVFAAAMYGDIGMADTITQQWRVLADFTGHVRDLAWRGTLLAAVDGPVRVLELGTPSEAWRDGAFHADRLAVSPTGELAWTDASRRVFAQRADGVSLPLPGWLRATDVAWAGPRLLAWAGDEAGVLDVQTGQQRVLARGDEWVRLDDAP